MVTTWAALAREAVRQAGLPATDLETLRVHSNAVFLLPDRRVVVRVGGGADAAGRARHAVGITRWLAQMRFPVVEPVDDVPQPVLLHDEAGDIAAVTFWHQVDLEDRPVTAEELARALRWLHRMPAPPFDVPVFRPLDRLVAVANSSGWLSGSDRGWLLDRVAHLQAGLDSIAAVPGRTGVVHGDAQLGNVLPVMEGPAVVADWDGVAVAPLMWDLVPTAMEPRFGGRPELLHELLAAYGVDPQGEPGWQVLCDVYELRSVAAHIRRAPRSAPHAAEAGVRLRSLRAGDRSVVWKAVS